LLSFRSFTQEWQLSVFDLLSKQWHEKI